MATVPRRQFADGLRLYSGSSGSTVRGLAIQNFTGDGIDVSGSNNNTIVGNYLGINQAGNAVASNGGWYRSDSVSCASDPACRATYHRSRPDMDARRHRVVAK